MMALMFIFQGHMKIYVLITQKYEKSMRYKRITCIKLSSTEIKFLKKEFVLKINISGYCIFGAGGS